MDQETITLTLGDHTFEVGALTGRQLRALRVGATDIAKADPDDPIGFGALYDRCFRTIHAAVSAKYPEVTIDALMDIPVRREKEILDASRAVLLHAGLVDPKPSIAELRSRVAQQEKDLAALKDELQQREAEAKQTGEASAETAAQA